MDILIVCGILHYSSVEVVVKDRDSLDTLDGWRTIWKTPRILKYYDSLKAESIQNDELENSAYCSGRSCMRALAKIFLQEL